MECGREECVQLLLEYRVAVDVKDSDHNTALHIAVRDGHANIARELIQVGADVNLRNKVQQGLEEYLNETIVYIDYM